MTQINTNELIGPTLDWAVAKCEGRNPSYYKSIIRATAHPDFPGSPPIFGPDLNYSTDWAQGGSIIEREGIDLNYSNFEGISGEVWDAACEVNKVFGGSTPLIAAMRCYVASKLGDTVDVPDELRQVNP